ncbi:MAG: hypothetical protein HF310_16210 [Ignavibacteria bacterium]|jgi:hypothetical protein|nr:hypothetical protein [Ignavibacteria bacterium]
MKRADGLEEHKLLTFQRNTLLLLLRDAGLNPTEFDFSETKSRHVSRLIVPAFVHNPTGYHFMFDVIDSRHACYFTPGADMISEEQYPGSWEALLNYFKKWIQFLKREIETPDLWKAIKPDPVLSESLSSVDPQDNAKFTPDELKHISSSIEELKAYIFKEIPLLQDKIDYINNQTTYLVDSSKRLGKKDWLNVAVGIIINIIFAIAPSENTARNIYTYAVQTLGWLVRNHFMINP